MPLLLPQSFPPLIIYYALASAQRDIDTFSLGLLHSQEICLFMADGGFVIKMLLDFSRFPAGRAQDWAKIIRPYMVWCGGGVVINDFHSSHSDSFPACHLLGFMFPVLLWPINWLYFSFRAFSGVGHDKMAALECSFELAPNGGKWKIIFPVKDKPPRRFCCWSCDSSGLD